MVAVAAPLPFSFSYMRQDLLNVEDFATRLNGHSLSIRTSFVK